MNVISNKEMVCRVLLKKAKIDTDIIVLTSDSRGSASMGEFAEKLPKQFIEVGIAEQNIVGIAAGLAASGKKPFVLSPACFLSTRSIEQIKIDVSYSNTNVKLIGISGGVSYGSLGMSHHSLQDMAFLRTIPGIQVVLPADRFETENVIEYMVDYIGPVFIRIGRNAVPDIYNSKEYDFEIGKAVEIHKGNDITIIANGETVLVAKNAASILKRKNISCRVINMHTVKPIDKNAIIKAAKKSNCIITLEEHSIYGGLGAAVSEVVAQNSPVLMKIIGIPDEPAISGKSKEVFNHYGIESENVAKEAINMLGQL